VVLQFLRCGDRYSSDFLENRVGRPFAPKDGMARRFQDLECWQLGRELRTAIANLVKLPAIARDFDLRDQLMGAARSVCANISEGFGRASHAEFARFLDIAIGSAREVQNHLTEAVDTGKIPATTAEPIDRLARRTAAAAVNLGAYLRSTPTPPPKKWKPRNPRATKPQRPDAE
jgi:four helix bundle protein